jgi:hypothetical protein
LLDLSLLKKLSASDEDRKIIKEKIDADFDKMETGKKLAVNLGAKNAFYLPAPAVLSEFLGFKFDLLTTIDQFESIGVKPPAISRAGKYDLQGKGVGKRTCKKYIDWIIDAPIPFLDNLIEGRNPRLDASAKVISNAFYWFSLFDGIKHLIKFNNDEMIPEYIPLLEFIEDRCNSEVTLQQYVRSRDDYNDSDLDNADIWWKKFAKPFFVKNTVLPLDALNSLDQLMATGSMPEEITDNEKNTLYKDILRLKFDFILAAIAHYEVGCVLAIYPNGEGLENLRPLACSAIEKYSTDDEDHSCFYWALEKFKDGLTEVEPDISWRKIARYIPINPESEETKEGNTKEQKQLDRLKSWRKGKNLPSNKLLGLFINNITESIGGAEIDSLFVLCRITIGLDKTLTNLNKKWSKEIGTESQFRSIWKDVLSHYYDDYYLHYLNQHIKKQK